MGAEKIIFSLSLRITKSQENFEGFFLFQPPEKYYFNQKRNVQITLLRSKHLTKYSLTRNISQVIIVCIFSVVLIFV